MTKVYCVLCAANGGPAHRKGCPCLGDAEQGLNTKPIFEIFPMDEAHKAQKRLYFLFNRGTDEEREAAEAKLKNFDVVA